MISVGIEFDEVEVAKGLVNKVLSMFGNSYIAKGYEVDDNNNVYMLLYDHVIRYTSRYSINDIVKHAIIERNTLLARSMEEVYN